MNVADRCPDYAGLLRQLIERPDDAADAHCQRCEERMHELRAIFSALKPLGIELQPSPMERDTDLIDRIIGAARTAQSGAPEARRALALAAAARELFRRDWTRARDLAAAAHEISLRLTAQATPAERALTRMARADCADTLGYCLVHLDQVREGERLIREAIESFDEAGDLLASGRARIHLMKALVWRKATEEAEQCAHSAIADLDEIGETLWAARARHCLAVTLYDVQRFSEAEQQFQAVQAVYRQEELPEEEAMVQVTLGKIALNTGHAAVALEKAQAAEALLHWAGNKADAARSRWLAGSARVALGDLAAGLNDLDDAATRLLALALWIEPALIRCEQAAALLNAGDDRTARIRLREIASLCPADEGNDWVRAALLAQEQGLQAPSAEQLRGVIRLLTDRLPLPAAAVEQGTVH